MTALRVLGVDPGHRTGLAVVRLMGRTEVVEYTSLREPMLKPADLDAFLVVAGVTGALTDLTAVYLEHWPAPAFRSAAAVQECYRILGRCEQTLGPLCQWKLHYVYPQVWRKKIGVYVGKRANPKAATLEWARQSFPGTSLAGCDDQADALGIAIYGLREEAFLRRIRR